MTMTNSRDAIHAPHDFKHLADFIQLETHALNDERYGDWLAMLTEDFEYIMPAPSSPEDPDLPRYSDDARLAWESYSSLHIRLEKRLASDFAWSDRPPAFHHRHVTSIRPWSATDRDIGTNETIVRSSLICVRSRVSEGTHWTSATREDLLREVDGALKLAERRVYIHEVEPFLSAISMIF